MELKKGNTLMGNTLSQYFDKFWNHMLNENSQKQIIQKIFERNKNASVIFFGFW